MGTRRQARIASFQALYAWEESRPEIDELPEGTQIPLGIVVEVAGREMQEEIVRLTQENSVLLCGPNSQGIFNALNGMSAGFGITELATGDDYFKFYGFISQSGGFGTSMYLLSIETGIHFTYFVSSGNEAGLSFSDYLIYMLNDKNTKAVGGYLEGVKEGRKLLYAADLALKQEKPVILIKSGRNAAAAKAAASHTGSMAGSIEVYDGVFRQAGVIRAPGIDEALDCLAAFEKIWFSREKPAGYRIGIVSGPGGPGVAMADACIEAGLEVPDINTESKKRLNEAIPGATASNPMDMGDFSFVARLKEEGPYSAMARIMYEDKNIDIVAIMGPGEFNPEGFRDEIYNIQDFCQKPFIVIWPAAGGHVEQCKKEIRDRGIALFDTQERAAKAIGALKIYDSYLKRIKKDLILLYMIIFQQVIQSLFPEQLLLMRTFQTLKP